MKTIINFFKNLKFIFMPNYWVMLGRYDKAWDTQLLLLAEQYDFMPENVFNTEDNVVFVSLGDVHMWIANYPYSFLVQEHVDKTWVHKEMTVYLYKWRDNNIQPRPSRLTIHKLHKKVIKDLKKHNLRCIK